MMVCPDCGSSEFRQTRVAQIEYTMVFDHGQWIDTSEVVTDGGDRDTDIVCDDCGREVDCDDDLVIEDEYNADDYEDGYNDPRIADCRRGFGGWE